MSDVSAPERTEVPVRTYLPCTAWLRGYPAAWLRHDVTAGVTLAAYAIPVSLAYATLAGLPPQHGIYGYLLGGLAYAVFGSSRQLAIGPTSAISMLVGASLAGMVAGDPARAVGLASLVALLFAAVALVAWALRLSSLVDFISETILLGFKAGAAFTIALTQLPKLFGVKGGGHSFFERLWVLVQQLPETRPAVLLFGLAAIGVLLLGERFLPTRPVPLLVVVASILALTFTPLAGMAFKTVGSLPPGLPSPTLPPLDPGTMDELLPLAFACFLLAYVEGVAAARALARRHGVEIDARQELLALGAANLAVAFGQGYPCAGGLSQSTVNDRAGARTPLALVVASAVIAACLLFLTGMLRNLPDVALAAIVLVAVKGLVNVPELRRVRRVSPLEFRVAMVAFAGVLLLGILKGVLLAAVVSLLLLIRRAAAPHVARLGRIPGTHRYSDLARHPDNEPTPGALVVRVEAALLYFNAVHVREQVRRFVAEAGAGLRTVVWDLSTSPNVDLAGVRMLGELQEELAARGVSLHVVDARSTVRALIREELGARMGEVTRRSSIEDALAAGGTAPAAPA